ncbi:MAG TPA: Flp family type IVb pilin [Acidobacteriaceae bacterium]|jgi:pilus assembly protein Flp/PilA
MTASTNFRHLLRDESGQDMVEYGLIVGLMALGAIISMKTLANSIVNTFATVGSTLTSST